MAIKYNIDATIASENAKDRLAYDTRKTFYRLHARQDWKQSDEAKSLNKVLKILLIIFGVIFFLCFIYNLLEGIPDLENIGLSFLWASIYGLPTTIIYLIVRAIKKKTFVEYYVSKKILEQIEKETN